MSAPLVVNTRDGACWTRRTVTAGGIALYAPEAVKTCPAFVMATLDDLAAHGIQGSADALPMPMGRAQVSEAELDSAMQELTAFLRVRLALESAKRGRRELRARVAELETAPRTVYRASHDSIVMGLYTTPAAARAHCEDEERRSWPTGTTLSFDWIEDEEDGVAELVVTAGQNEESTTGYVVTPLEIASEYDAEADE